jgi:hypothetical protein
MIFRHDVLPDRTFDAVMRRVTGVPANSRPRHSSRFLPVLEGAEGTMALGTTSQEAVPGPRASMDPMRRAALWASVMFENEEGPALRRRGESSRA